MSANWMRRTLWPLALAALALLGGCGASSIESALKPTRILSVGDTLSDLGQTGTRFTVNDGSVNIWTQDLAGRYGLTLTTAVGGGKSYAQAHARVSSAVDAVGGSVPSIKAQIDTLLASTTFTATDMVLVTGGISDIIAEVAAGSADMTTRVRQAGTDLGTQVRRLVTGGAKYVVVVGPYNLGQSRWSYDLGQRQLLKDLSLAFTEALLISVQDLSENVLYVDAALYFNLVTASPGSYGFVDAGYTPDFTTSVTPAIMCTSVDARAGIGVGTGKVSSGLCTTSTIASGMTYDQHIFADSIFFTPQANRKFGEYAYEKITNRW